jgi:hypothetical protein
MRIPIAFLVFFALHGELGHKVEARSVVDLGLDLRKVFDGLAIGVLSMVVETGKPDKVVERRIVDGANIGRGPNDGIIRVLPVFRVFEVDEGIKHRVDARIRVGDKTTPSFPQHFGGTDNVHLNPRHYTEVVLSTLQCSEEVSVVVVVVVCDDQVAVGENNFEACDRIANPSVLGREEANAA